ncbi:MAG TPA: selenocysteine-specific translation elongation factor [Solirubrobacteraceae bacterium]|nr:selenocysteine-specific translation elongation factor [Solirubrobacteraceae bacterium]
MRGAAGGGGVSRVSAADAPLTLGTAGHIDHGKTALVRALTGVDTDRLPAERERGMTIELGYAPLALPDGRRLSVVDVPGHERFVRAMVAGATGIDMYLMTIAADDGVMPQTREHATVLDALGVRAGVVAITKSDVRDPEPAIAAARRLLPNAEIVACSARTGDGLHDVLVALGRVAAGVRPRASVDVPAVLHADRAFTIHGAGTVLTGTLWSGAIARGDTLTLLPDGRSVRVRGVQVHGAHAEVAVAGQRVAVNLTGVPIASVARGDALVGAGAPVRPRHVLDVALTLREAPGRPLTRVQVHHGTRDAPARLVALSDRYFQVRLERPLLVADGDRVVIRRIAPPDTLGGGVVLDAAARRHGRRAETLARLARIEAGEEPEPPATDASKSAASAVPGSAASAAPAALASAASEPGADAGAPAPEPLAPGALALAQRLLDAGHEPPSLAQLGDDAVHLPALRDAGIAVRIGRDMYAHVDAVATVRERVAAIIRAEGQITLARLRDELRTSRKFAQALLEHLDAARVTRRRPDDSRVLRRS